MDNSVLKKEFSEKDIKRVRNLVKGKHGEKTKNSVGYGKKYVKHNEGDQWEEDGKLWEVKNGIKQNITKLDKAKKITNFPLFCPNCGSKMKERIDKPYIKIHGVCLNCVIEKEHQLKKENKWTQYQKDIKNDEIDNYIKELKGFTQSKLDSTSNSFISEDGDMEKWVGKINPEEVKKYESEIIKYLESLKDTN